jgi:hypothetical protein
VEIIPQNVEKRRVSLPAKKSGKFQVASGKIILSRGLYPCLD